MQSQGASARPGSNLNPAVRLYLSSFRLGEDPELLVRLTGERAHIVVIANAMDDAPADVRRQAVQRELQALSDLGLRPAELDLRSYFGNAAPLSRDLARYGAVWVRGGKVFMLRYALYRAGGDTILAGALQRDALVYAGYSAGPCVLAPSLRGLEAVDNAGAVARIYGASPVWAGLGVLGFSIVPHCQSPGHPESARLRAGRQPV
jgi:dipeptidase E